MSNRDQTKKLIEKYRDGVIMSMFLASNKMDDEGVCLAKLVYMANNLGNPEAEVYPGVPEDFDWETFQEEIKGLTVEDETEV